MDILPFRTSCNRSHSCPKSTRQGTPSLLHQVNAVNMLFFCAQKCGLCYQAEIMDGESLLKKQPFRQHFYLLSLHDLQLASLYRKGPIRSSGKRLHHQLCLLIAIGDPFLHLTQVPCPQVCLHTGIPRVYFPQKHKSITGPAGTKPARSAEKGPPPDRPASVDQKASQWARCLLLHSNCPLSGGGAGGDRHRYPCPQQNADWGCAAHSGSLLKIFAGSRSASPATGLL